MKSGPEITSERSRKMSKDNRSSFSEKHGGSMPPEAGLAAEIQRRAKNASLACAVAFDIAADLGKSPAEVGKAADLLNLRLEKCQLGLFGYGTRRKIADPRPPSDETLAEAIRQGKVDDRLPCKTAWEIAARFKVSKLSIGNACEFMGIKIKPCQLGAF
jgi:hypothetical protein